ncbi:uncharacterized protein MONOS_4259 [Monocercomonoides exilis]|uniref:uncharacterized protein n=1 Tax=Monocercomonoides exilis TaxID=2049356 RepID=UPI003559A383|nr:hypothetical protein MONOS_4259 [Monocercomonoides exilis]|eukprot:MONOS_4259.1-p1 / transcript=MONOS_4259.1 / gene=MONOS_4259 / organism=Monocercomonoides_exilis_PA203 / gene_product=unspecified product / transcript_product=unspecified product / location=Mono_scaffold00111:28028-29789(+) / protein_length=519 / sequence_SO=supercontig / SO=protein_coding / is_pseudo=false
MGCCVADNHTSPAASFLHKVFDFLYMLVGVLFIFLGVSYASVAKGNGKDNSVFNGFFFFLVIAGAILVVFGFIGLFASGYYKPGGEDRRICLFVFFVLSLVLTLLLTVIAILCFAATDFIESFRIKYWNDITDAVFGIKGGFGEFISTLVNLLNSANAVGIAMIICAVLLALGFILSCVIMGKNLFVQTTNILGCIIILLVGAGIIVIALVLFREPTDAVLKQFMDIFKKVLGGSFDPYLVVMIVGIVFAVFALIGVISSCTCVAKRTMCPTVIASIMIGLLMLIAAAICIFLFLPQARDMMQEPISTAISGLCNITESPTQNVLRNSVVPVTSSLAISQRVSRFRRSMFYELGSPNADEVSSCKIFGEFIQKDACNNGVLLFDGPDRLKNEDGTYSCNFPNDLTVDDWSKLTNGYFNYELNANFRLVAVCALIAFVFLLLVTIMLCCQCCCLGGKIGKDEGDEDEDERYSGRRLDDDRDSGSTRKRRRRNPEERRRRHHHEHHRSRRDDYQDPWDEMD